ncbi:MAG: dTDP-4-dehydrorhamnose reductase, partial [Deltaproteobacteria bacterium]|nr:dTDP-4-dehydrorhamnose reductase [Deltaproteobacteria bacterium]
LDQEGTLAALDQLRPTVVINAAAYTAVDRAESEPALAYGVNAPAALVGWCAERNARLIHVSTDYIFDGTKDAPYVEDDPPAPLGVYGASKLAGERMIRASGVRHVIVRTSWVVGRHGSNFVKTIARLAGERDVLRVVADQRGRPTPARRLAEALLGLADHPAEGTFHFAGDPPVSWWDVARYVAPPGVDVVPITTAEYPTPAKRPANSVLDCSRWLAEVGIPLPDWREGVREILESR